MNNSMKFTLRNFNCIDNVELEIGKITVIGGQNSTGKSTVSKFLFSFLKSNSSKRRDLSIQSIDKQIRDLIFKFNDYIKINPDKKSTLNFSSEDFFNFIQQLDKSKDLKSKITLYNNLKSLYINNNINNGYKHEFDNHFQKIDKLVTMINENDTSLFISVMRKLLKSEFSTKDFNCYSKLEGNYNNISYKFSINFENTDFNDDNSFKYIGGFQLNDVFYIDSTSILDLSQHYGLQNSDHFKFLSQCINPEEDESSELFDDKLNDKINNLENQIKKLINGQIKYENGVLVFISDDGREILMKNTASGIKQIGIIQLLLSHRKLKENSFLIIDEPEVNLHPKWQVKLAKILVLLANELNINIYINSHSPMFIESMSVFSNYYNLQNETNFYLTKKSDNGFNFKKIANNDLGEVYNNLAEPYDELDLINAELSYKIK